MSFESNLVSLVGNVVRDPELRYTGSGVPVVSLTVAWNPKEGDAVFVPVTCWRDLADNVSGRVRKGDRVAVLGSLKLSKWQTKDGESRERLEVVADEVSLSNRFGERSADVGEQFDATPVPF